ncbi:peroxidase 1 [Tanacetum coccineum]
MGPFILIQVLSLLIFPEIAFAELKQNYYANICPDVETIVQKAVAAKLAETPITVQGTLRLLFHDCFIEGCDASIMIQSSGSNTAEKDHPENLSLAGDGFDTVMKAKAAVDAVPSCKNKVSCADILIMAARDVVHMAGGPSYPVELGRLDGLSSTEASVNGKLPKANQNLDQLNAIFAANGLNQTEMIALSGAHTIGFSHCDQFLNRIYNFSKQNPVDPTLIPSYATELQRQCPKNFDPQSVIPLDPSTTGIFDNMYYKNLQNGQGLLTSDQVLFTDTRSKRTVISWANSPKDFSDAFVKAMTKLGRVGVKTGQNGNTTVSAKVKLQPNTIPGTLRLFFHDCFVQGCDALIMIQSSGSNMAEKDHQDNLSLAGDGFDMVNKAKAAVDAVPSCRNKVSCADILTMATRDVIKMAGGPSYPVELGRLDGISSTAAGVNGKLPKPKQNLDQLNAMFAANGLTQVDMIALSGNNPAKQYELRIYNFSKQNPVDPTLNPTYATQLQQQCPKGVDPLVAIHMDPNTPTTFDNMYFKNLQQGQRLFTSDQVLYTDTRSKQTVISWANDPKAFNNAFIAAMTKLG